MDSTETALRVAVMRRHFSRQRRGYSTAEVDDLLDTVTVLAEELLDAAAGTSRHLAEAEAELLINRAEVRELREVAAATEQLLAGTRAELKAARLGAATDNDVDGRLVVAEAELRVLRAAAEGTEWALAEAQENLAAERAARETAQAQLAAVRAELAELRASVSHDRFAEVGAEVAGVLRAAAAAADDIRWRARQAGEAMVEEAGRRAASIAEEARAAVALAEERTAEADSLAGRPEARATQGAGTD